MNIIIPFYDDYFIISEGDKAKMFKDTYIRKKTLNSYIYKFIAFTNNSELNNNKIQLIKERKLWLSTYNNFQDKNEIITPCDINKISKSTGIPPFNLNYFIFNLIFFI